LTFLDLEGQTLYVRTFDGIAPPVEKHLSCTQAASGPGQMKKFKIWKILDSGSDAFSTPGSGMGKIQIRDPG
jgi:hypothetical protein